MVVAWIRVPHSGQKASARMVPLSAVFSKTFRVPLTLQAELLAVCQDKLKQEANWLAEIAAGKTMAELIGLGEAEIIGD